ncbi:hypothetical protein HK104_000030 [Borealophlyctis nickersoniae]|nr:hypothetical protein HK104_000030 [Borealophlyctis nickersoniae]
MQPHWDSAGDAYRLLRHRLDQLDYKEQLPHDAVPLVRKLLADLIRSTETARRFKNEAEMKERDKGGIEEQVAPLRQEIARLTAENNHLHSDLIRLADERDARERRTAQAARRMESQAADLRFMTSQYAHRIEVEQKRVEEARSKAEEAMAKMGAIHAAAAGGKDGGKDKKGSKGVNAKAEKLFQKLQKIDVETGLEPLENPPARFVPPDPVVADMVKLAEGRIEMLETLNKDLSAKNLDLENQVQLIREQLTKREQEIQRLGAQLEISRAQQFSTVAYTKQPTTNGDVTGDRQPSIHELPIAKQRIEQLELQIEYLQEHIEGLEKEVSGFDEEKQTLYAALDEEKRVLAEELQRERERSAGLMKNLGKLEGLVNELGTLTPGSPKKGTDREREANKENMDKLSVDQIRALRNGLRKQEKRIGELSELLKTNKQALQSSNEQSAVLETQCDKLAQETRQLTISLSDAEARLSTARDEITQLRESMSRTETKGGAESAQKDALLTESRFSMEKQIQNMRRLELENGELAAKLREVESQKWTTENDLRNLQQKVDQYGHMEAELSSLRSRAQALQKEITAQQTEISRLSRALNETEKAKEQANSQNQKVAEELKTVQREREVLLSALQKFEAQLSEVQTNVEIITADRDNLAQLYEQVNQELQLLRQRSSSSPSRPLRETRAPSPSAPPAVAIQTNDDESEEVNKLRNSEEALRRRNEELEREIDNLQRDLRATVLRQRESGASANEAMKQLEKECEGLREAIFGKEKEWVDLEEKAKSLERQLARVQEELAERDRTAEQLRRRIAQLEMERDRDTFQLRDNRSKLSETEARLERTQAELNRLSQENEDRVRQLSEQRQLLNDVDRERDAARVELDRKAERIVELQAVIGKMKEDALRAEQDLFELREQTDVLNHHLNEQDRELDGLRRQVDTLSRERDQWANEAQRSGEEARNVAADLAALSKENQILNGELAELASDRERYKAELAECERQVQYLDELIRTKEQEREHLVASYRKLAGEHERLDVTLRTFTEESNTMRMEVVLRDKRVQQLQKALDDAGVELTQSRIDLGAYEKQCNSKSLRLARFHFKTDKARLLREIAAARDLSLSVERTKDDLQKRLTAVTVDNESMHATLRKLETDCEALNAQMRAEKLKAERLEHLVAIERTRKIQTEKGVKEMRESQGTLEEQLQALNHQQKLTIQSMTRDLKASHEEARALKIRIEGLEKTLRDQKDALMQSEDLCGDLRREVADLKELLANKERIVEDLMRLGGEVHTGPKSDLEQRILDELESTKRQLRKYEEQIERRFKASEHVVTTRRSKGTTVGTRSTSRSHTRVSEEAELGGSEAESTTTNGGDILTSSDDAIADGKDDNAPCTHLDPVNRGSNG